MELGNIGNKILNPIDKNATVIGAGLRLIQKIDPLTDSITRLLQGNVHAPNFTQIFNTWGDPSLGIAPAIVAVIGAELAKDAGNNMVKKIANIVSKAGIAYIVVGMAEPVLYFSTHSPGYPGTSGAGSASQGYSY